MGEYATRRSDGSRIKIGTCEDMYYLRWDQRDQVTGGDASYLHDPEVLASIRFRFPFPSEDEILPGDFEDYNKGLRLSGFKFPEDMEHSSVQFSADNGYLVSLPCPESAESYTLKLGDDQTVATIHRNGYGGEASLVQQGWRGGRLVGIARCNGCHNLFRLEDGAELQAEEIATADQQAARGTPTEGNRDNGNALHELADRLMAGYSATLEPTPKRALRAIGQGLAAG